SGALASLVLLAVEETPQGAGLRPHQYRLGLEPLAITAGTLEDRAIGDTGRGEDHVLAHHVVAGVDAIEILDSVTARPIALLVVAEDEPALDLAAHAFERGRGQHPFRRS